MVQARERARERVLRDFERAQAGLGASSPNQQDDDRINLDNKDNGEPQAPPRIYEVRIDKRQLAGSNESLSLILRS